KRPSGEKAAVAIACVPKAEVAIGLGVSKRHNSFPVATSQRRTVPSCPPVRNRLPSGENPECPTQPDSCRNWRIGSPVSKSHNSTIGGLPPVKARRPSGDKLAPPVL